MKSLKTIFQSIKKLNIEYIVLFFVLISIGFFIRSAVVVSQQRREITLATIYPIPTGRFNLLSAKLFRDYDNPLNRFADPAGESKLSSLVVDWRIIIGREISGPTYMKPSPEHFFNLQFGNAKFDVVRADRLYQGSNGPAGINAQRGGGKFVYDISEGVYGKDCQPGDVVITCNQDDVDVTKSTEKFSNKIVGVISGNPKIYMGKNEKKIPLALAGIVECKVTNENGFIKRGDLLVSSSLPGHAMKASMQEVAPGMILGKALQELTEDKGKILILVNRQ